MTNAKRLVVSLDLEFNQPSQKIIQIGAVLGDLDSATVMSRFNCFVDPEEPLNPIISSLCGIAPEALELSNSLPDAYVELQNWLRPFNACRQLNPLTWGGGDSMALKSQLGLKDKWEFGRRWVDVKTVYIACQTVRGGSTEGGLKPSMRKLGVPFHGRPHDAADDAHSTFLMYCKLLSLMKEGLAPSVQVQI